MNPHEPDSRIAKMKDGSTHLAHKAEHAVDLETGALLAVVLHAADQGDTSTLMETLAVAGEQAAAVLQQAQLPAGAADELVVREVVADKGYHSDQMLEELAEAGVRSYLPEKQQTRNWKGKPEQKRRCYANRRRVRGRRGKSLLRKRGEHIERSFSHVYDTGGMRRTHLRRHDNILKRLLIHAGAFNLGLLLRAICGVGKPRRLQGRKLRPENPQLALLFCLYLLQAADPTLNPPSASASIARAA